MNIYAESGTRVKYLDEHGYESQRVHARKYMDKDQILTVAWVDIGQSSSSVYFHEISHVGFNTVMFEGIE